MHRIQPSRSQTGTARHPSLLPILALALLLGACGSRDDAGRGAAASDSVSTGIATAPDGLRIAWSSVGSGDPALVFVHGWSCDRGYWDAQVRHFAATHRVVTIDLAGHGASDTTRTSWTVEAYAGDVTAVIEALGLRDVILIGHSMGGPIVVEAARQVEGTGDGGSADGPRGTRVRGIIGVDTFQDVTERFPDDQREAFLDGFRNDYARTAEGFIRGMFPATADSALVDAIVRDMLSAPRRVAVGSMETMFLYDIGAALREMRRPARAVNCDLWPTNVEGNRRHFASFDLMLMPGVGHFPMREDSIRFNTLLADAIAAFGR